MAKTANEEILDATIRHQIKLLRFSAGEASMVAALLEESDKELAALLKTELTDFSEARIRKMLAEVKRLRTAVAETIHEQLTGDMQELAPIEAEWEQAMLMGATPIALTYASVPVVTLKAVAGSPINGIPLEGWLGRMTANDVSRIEQQIRLGVLQGETLDQLTRRLLGTKAAGYADGVVKTTRREAEMIARTAVNHVSASARQATWDANADIISGVRWVATLDGRTSPVCQGRDGQLYAIDKGPRPPAHPNCRSTIAPVLAGEQIVSTRDTLTDTRTRRQREIDFRAESKAAAGSNWSKMTEAQRRQAIRLRKSQWAAENIGSAPTTTNYDTWLRGQAEVFQDKKLGKAKADLFRGGMTLDKFVDESGKPYSMAQLRASVSADKLYVTQPGVGLKAKSLLQQGLQPQQVLDQIKKEFPDASTSMASIASYKSELNKAGALNLGPESKVPFGALKQAKVVADIVTNMEANLPANVKHAIGGQWASVVDDLTGSPGAYGYYEAGKGVMLSGKKLAAVPAAQAQQVVAHELGHLLHKQHDLLLPPDVYSELKAAAKALPPGARKQYAYYLSHLDELTAEVYAQALSPSALTSQGLNAIEFNKAFGPAIQAAKKSMADKFPMPMPKAPTPLQGAPSMTFEVAGKHTTVGSLAKALLQQGMPDSQVLASVLAEFPTAQTKLASIQSYKSQLKKGGLLPNKASGPIIKPTVIPDVAPVPPKPEVAIAAPEPVLPSLEKLSPSKLKDAAIAEMKSGVLGNKDIADQLVKKFPQNTADVNLAKIATWKSLWKKGDPAEFASAVSKGEAAAVKASTAGPVQKPALYGVQLGGTSKLALEKVKSALMAGGDKSAAYTAMSKVFGALKEPGAGELYELAMYELATIKSAAKPYFDAAVKSATAPAGFVVDHALEKFSAGLSVTAKMALDAYKHAMKVGWGPIKTNKYVKMTAGYEPSASAKVKLKAAAKYELSKSSPGAAKPGASPSATVLPPAVEIKPSRLAATPRQGLPPPPRFTPAQREAGIVKYVGKLESGIRAKVNRNQLALRLPELGADEVAAIRSYTGGTYRRLNNALRDGKYASDPALQAYVEAAQAGLAKMPKFKGISSRGMRFDDAGLKRVLTTYRTGAVVEDSAFVSTSSGDNAAFSGNVYMRIKGKTGVDVSQYSHFPGEREVLFMPGTQFQVDEIRQENGKYIITMTEL